MKALVADPESARGRRVAAACASRGLSVEHVSHGAQALERAIASPPDLIVCPLSLPMIDGARLSDILRTNPRTKDVAFLFLVEDELDVPVGMDARDRFVLAPWPEEELARQIDAALKRELRVRDPSPGQGIEGNLAQVPLVDLLQLFHGNKKSGTMRLLPEHAEEAGTIVLRGGEVVDAAVPAEGGLTIRGVKALFRLMRCREGRFEFLPEDPGGPPQIQIPTRALLLEAMRQIDEGERFRQTLPSPSLRVRPGPSTGALAQESPPLTADVLRAVGDGATVQEIVDRVPHPDYQILRTIHTLLSRDVLEPEPSPSPSAEEAEAFEGALGVSQTARLRDWAATRHPPIVGHLRVPVVATDASALERLLRALLSVQGFRSTHPETTSLGPEHLGPIAELPIGDGLSLLLVAMPFEERFRPVWPVAAHGMLGGIVAMAAPLRASLPQTEEVRALLGGTRQPVVHALVGGDAADRDAESLALDGPVVAIPAEGGPSARAAVREILAALLP